MDMNCVEPQSFKGKLVTVNSLSNKPKRYLNKVHEDIQKLVKNKEYNLYFQQDYGKNEMRIIADYPFPLKPSQQNLYFTRTQINIPITSKASKYIATAKDVIEKFENNMRKNEQQVWEQKQRQQKRQDSLDTIETFLFAPVFIFGDILHDINPKWAKNF